MNTRRIRPLAAFAAALLLVSTAGTAPAQIPIDPDPARVIQNETSLALIPSPVPGVPALLAVAYNNAPTTPAGLGVALSTDGGGSWANNAIPPPLDPGGSGLQLTDAFDPAAVFDGFGFLYVAQISTLFGWPGASGLFVHQYDPNSGAWGPPSTVSYNVAAVGNPDPTYRFNDKCHLTVDDDRLGVSPFANNLYAVWIQDGGYNVGAFSDIFFARSVDQAMTWQYPGGSPTPVAINDTPYVPGGPPSDLANGPNAAVAPDGTVYVSWTDIDVTQPQAPGTIFIDRSTNAGATWGTDVPVAAILGCPGNLSTMTRADARARSFSCLAVSPVSNPGGFYDVYMVFPADPDGPGPDEADVFFTMSSDGGTTWKAPARVNQDATACDQFQPWIRVKPNGTIDIAWYDRRNDPTDTFWDVCITRSDNRGATFAPPAWITDPTTTFASPRVQWGERWMGEYLGLGVDSRFAYVAFTSSISDTLGDVYFAAIENTEMPTVVPETASVESVRPEVRGSSPFHPGDAFSMRLPVPANVTLEVVDVAGRHVRTLVRAFRTAGEHGVVWDGRDEAGRAVAAGVYLVRLTTPGGRGSLKVALLR